MDDADDSLVPAAQQATVKSARRVLEVLRQPLEDAGVRVAVALGALVVWAIPPGLFHAASVTPT